MKLEGANILWEKIAKVGPSYALPQRYGFSPIGIKNFNGAAYAALYDKKKLNTLLEFNIFQCYASSIMQIQFQNGEIDMDWFYENNPNEILPKLIKNWSEEKLLNKEKTNEFIKKLQLPESISWITDLEFINSEINSGDEKLEMTANTEQGFLTLFVVDDQ